MEKYKEDIKKSVDGKKTAMLFTGDKGSTFLMHIVKSMNIHAIFVDTGHHFDEIMRYIEKLRDKVEVIKQNDAGIVPTIQNDMAECCTQRKAVVLMDYLDDIKAECLIVPFRNDGKENGIEDSYLHKISNIKIIRPLADITESGIWLKIKEYKLPFSAIYNKGYRIIDCKCCTTRHGRRKKDEKQKSTEMDKETEEKLKSLGYI